MQHANYWLPESIVRPGPYRSVETIGGVWLSDCNGNVNVNKYIGICYHVNEKR
jgi:hypothetical protein